MLSQECVYELRSSWLPNLTDAGLERLITLLETASPYLVHGCFTRSVPMGCLATHAAWHHPQTAHLTIEAGISWLHQVAKLNPATSLVIREWDRRGIHDWKLRNDLAAVLREERTARQKKSAAPNRCAEFATV